MNKRIKQSGSLTNIPQTRDQVITSIARIGELQRELTRINANMGDELADVKERYEKGADPLRSELEMLQNGVHIWCSANREQITGGGKTKTVSFPSGDVCWRMRPPSVAIKGVAAVLDALVRAGLNRFVRVKEEINKDAILNEPEAVRAIPGITINQGEDFVITPFEAALDQSGGS